MIYLDHAATTPVRPEVADLVAKVQSESFANPSSPHAMGRRAKAILEDARETILGLAGAVATGHHRDRLVFTSGATEANHLAIRGLGEGARAAGRRPGTVFVSARDHASVREAAQKLSSTGFALRTVGLSSEGLPDWESQPLGAGNRESIDILSTTIVCSQTGVIDAGPKAAVSDESTHVPRLLRHADATQAAPLIDLAFGPSGMATCSLSAHKLGGPRGVGAVIVRRDHAITPLMAGSQESGLRGGTECVALAAGFALAFGLAAENRLEESRRIQVLRDVFEENIVRIASRHGCDARIMGQGKARSPHISTVAFRGVDRQAIVMAADIAGIAISSGTACSSGSTEPSPAIIATGIPPAFAGGAVRLSFGRSTTAYDIQCCLERFDSILGNFRTRGICRVEGEQVCISGMDR